MESGFDFDLLIIRLDEQSGSIDDDHSASLFVMITEWGNWLTFLFWTILNFNLTFFLIASSLLSNGSLDFLTLYGLDSLMNFLTSLMDFLIDLLNRPLLDFLVDFLLTL